ncbi:WS/DGAT domain-containing protein [Streptomyces ziwulingensis]
MEQSTRMPLADSMMVSSQERYAAPATLAALLRLSGPPLHLRELTERVERAWGVVPRLWLRPHTDDRGRPLRPYRWLTPAAPLPPAPVAQERLDPGERLEHVVSRLMNRCFPLVPGGLLWDVHLLHDAAARRQTVVLSVHHALLDGQSLGVLMRLLCQGPGALTPATAHGVTVPFTHRYPSGGVRATASVLTNVTLPAPRHDRVRAAGNQPAVGWSTVPRQLVATARRALPDMPVTVNDVVLAAFAGALRAVPGTLGDRPVPTGVHSAVPVSMRQAMAAEHHLGNLAAAVRVRLPLEVDDPVRRLHHVHRVMTGHKRRRTAMGAARIMAVLVRPEPVVVDLLGELTLANPWMRAVSCSNVRLCDTPLRLAGRPVEDFFTLSCLPPRMSVLTMFTTYEDTHTLALTARHVLGPGLPRLASAFLREVEALADRAVSPGHRPPPAVVRSSFAACLRAGVDAVGRGYRARGHW